LNFFILLEEIEHKAIFNLHGWEKGKDILWLKWKLFQRYLCSYGVVCGFYCYNLNNIFDYLQMNLLISDGINSILRFVCDA
jgi:hypothetical protein